MVECTATERTSSAGVELDIQTGHIRVLLVDDHTFIGSAIEVMLADQTDMELLYCQNAEDGLKMALQFEPHVILQDLIMPGHSPVNLITQYRKNQKLVSIPLIVLSNVDEPQTKAMAFENGVNDYLVKPPQRVELVARIRYHATAYKDSVLRNNAVRMIRQSQQVLLDELSLASSYVRSLLPEKLTKGPVKTNWLYQPCRHVGGDMIGYHWLDENHFLMYALDIAGHGFQAALMAVTAMNLLKHHLLPGANYYKPTTVLDALNKSFKMKDNKEMFITMWYGIYNVKTRMLAYANAAYPPAMLTWPTGDVINSKRLDSDGIIIGAEKEYSFQLNSTPVPPNSKLFIFSDGTFEFKTANKNHFCADKFYNMLTHKDITLKSLLDKIIEIHGEKHFPDDISMMEICFN